MQNTLFEDEALGEIVKPVSVGQLLKEGREAQGISLETAAQNLRIGIIKLVKLETDDETLVCDVYTLGALRSYAKFLGLNTPALIQKFKEQVTLTPSVILDFPSPPPERGIPTVRILILSSLLFFCVALVAGYHWWELHKNSQNQNVDDTQVESSS